LPVVPNPWIAAVLALIVIALSLFATERIRLHSAALLVFITLLLVFGLAPYPLGDGEHFDPAELFGAFGNEALIAVCALMILGKGVETTRALQPLVVVLSKHWSQAPGLMMGTVMVVAAALSAFLNNTPIVVILLPALAAIAHRNRLAPSKILMPIGFATIIGGMATTIGTSTNLLVVNLSEDLAGIPFGMFDFSWYVIVAGAVGIGFLWLVGPRLLPERTAPLPEPEARSFVAMLRVKPGSRLEGATVAEFLNLCGRALEIDQIESESGRARRPLPTVRLEALDRISVRGDRAALKEAENVLQAPLTDLDHSEHRDPETEPKLFEVLVTRNSNLDGKSLSEIDFQGRFGVAAVALHRPMATRRGLYSEPEHARLETGDIVLCQGTERQLQQIVENTSLLLLRRATDLPFTHRSTRAILIIIGVVAIAALGYLPIAISALLGVGLMIATRCLGWRHVGEALNTQVVMVIVVSLALGKALIVTGGDAYLARLLMYFLAGVGPFVIVLVFMGIAAVLTNIVTNNAAAVIVTPIAIQAANQLAIAPEAGVLAVLFGANLSFMTPMGYQTNLLVLNDGGYRFSDFLRVGIPLTIIMGLVIAGLLKVRYGL
jgi:di/tricarboxylate transporter